MVFQTLDPSLTYTHYLVTTLKITVTTSHSCFTPHSFTCACFSPWFAFTRELERKRKLILTAPSLRFFMAKLSNQDKVVKHYIVQLLLYPARKGQVPSVSMQPTIFTVGTFYLSCDRKTWQACVSSHFHAGHVTHPHTRVCVCVLCDHELCDLKRSPFTWMNVNCAHSHV